MPNTIRETQNTKQQLEYLAAQRFLYSRAKLCAGLQAGLSVPLAIAWSVGANVYPDLKPWAALWGLLIAMIDQGLLEGWQSGSKQLAAKVQEVFDCAVLKLPWNNLVVGSRPDPEQICEAAEKYKADDRSPLQNWYSREITPDIPLPYARLICQRTNLWWDSKLRRIYGRTLLGGAAFIFAVSLITGLARHFSLEDFLLTFWIPVSPAYLWAIREFRKQQSVAKTSEGHKIYLEGIWAKLLSGGIPVSELEEQESRKLQDEIYRRRRDGALVFSWLYNRLRGRHEGQADKGAAELVRELRASGLLNHEP
jgi:hypothetical protein